ncbi:hypothetical protein C809_03975 [Lachnospiraceae bacterium MD335]|jgi:hypothetical protein|nr:hypothetical protein C809_03975 [Lachnospiraceae bacterium MD335]
MGLFENEKEEEEINTSGWEVTVRLTVSAFMAAARIGIL